MTDVNVARMRNINDALRTAETAIGALLANGQVVITRGLATRGNGFISRAVEAVRRFRDFRPDNDLYGCTASTTSEPSSSTARRSTGGLTTTTWSCNTARRILQTRP